MLCSNSPLDPHLKPSWCFEMLTVVLFHLLKLTQTFFVLVCQTLGCSCQRTLCLFRWVAKGCDKTSVSDDMSMGTDLSLRWCYEKMLFLLIVVIADQTVDLWKGVNVVCAVQRPPRIKGTMKKYLIGSNLQNRLDWCITLHNSIFTVL